VAKLTDAAVVKICQQFFGRAPDAMHAPGGATRRTRIVEIGSDTFAVSKRASQGRAALEAKALKTLAQTGLTPELVACEGEVVVQSFVEGTRLSAVLDAAPNPQDVMVQAAQSLRRLQTVAMDSGLQRHLPKIGRRAGWLSDLTRVPEGLARRLSLPPPVLDCDRLEARLSVHRWTAVKWDARPGNALCTPDGRIVWFDWEHCGLRTATDDLAWLLADEWCPSGPETETLCSALFDPEDQARFLPMAAMHACLRLNLIARYKAEGDWWARSRCLAEDRVGITATEAARQVAKLRRWAGADPDLSGLKDFADVVQERLMQTPVHGSP